MLHDGVLVHELVVRKALGLRRHALLVPLHEPGAPGEVLQPRVLLRVMPRAGGLFAGKCGLDFDSQACAT